MTQEQQIIKKILEYIIKHKNSKYPTGWYQIVRRVDLTRDNLSPPTFYILQKAVEQGLVTVSESSENHSIYSITAEGEEWLSEITSVPKLV